MIWANCTCRRQRRHYHSAPRDGVGRLEFLLTDVGRSGYPPRMGGDERTEFGTPIPLRGKGFSTANELIEQARDLPAADRPNPWTRLEAVAAAATRVGWLVETLNATPGDVDHLAVSELLAGLATELQAAVWGDLAACEAVRAHRDWHKETEHWHAVMGA